MGKVGGGGNTNGEYSGILTSTGSRTFTRILQQHWCTGCFICGLLKDIDFPYSIC